MMDIGWMLNLAIYFKTGFIIGLPVVSSQFILVLWLKC